MFKTEDDHKDAKEYGYKGEMFQVYCSVMHGPKLWATATYMVM